MLKFPASLRSREKFFPISVDICQTKCDTFLWAPLNLDVVYFYFTVTTTPEVMQKEIFLTA